MKHSLQWMRDHRRGIRVVFAALILMLVLSHWMSIGFADAAETESLRLAGEGTGLGGNFDSTLSKLATGTIKALQAVLMVMTAIAGMMVAFGLQEGNKFLWQAMLGIGLAVNFGAFLTGTGLWSMADEAAQTAQVQKFEVKFASGDNAVESASILGDFMNHYTKDVITPGAANILPYCMRLLIILTVIQASWELSIKFSGDKLQYLIQMTLKVGFFLFLMMNWITFMNALMGGFETLGLRAGGSDASPDNIMGTAADEFFKITWKLVATIFTAVDPTAQTGLVDKAGAIGTAYTHGPSFILLSIITIVIVGFCLLRVALEMFMARVEFYTMALLTIPCLAFGTMGKFAFLAEKAIGCMFNCALKVCVIAFLAVSMKDYIGSFIEKIPTKDGLATISMGAMLQVILASILCYMLVTKIPQLVSTMLNGNPNLTGSDMVGTMKSVANAGVNAAATAAGGVGAVRAASAAASAAGKGGLKGTLTQLGRNYVMSRKPVRAYRGAIDRFRNTKDYTGSKALDNIKNGVSLQQERQGAKTDSRNKDD